MNWSGNEEITDYSKTCLKPGVKIDKKKDLNDKW